MTESKSTSAKQEIDLFGLIRKLWCQRKIVYRVLGIAFLIGIIISYSIPKEYSVTVTLAPESSRRTSSSLASMAAMMGLGNLATGTESDALNVLFYPEIIASTPFSLELYNMMVQPQNANSSISLHEYLDEERRPWWNIIMSLPGKAVGGVISLFKSNNDSIKSDTLNPFRLTRAEAGKLGAIKKAIKADVDKKSGMTTIVVTFQDPVVTATVADSVLKKLQNYVTNYRTQKAIVDYIYWEKLYKEKQQAYYKAQQIYATYLDENRNLYTQKAKNELERLQNEMNLAFQIYNQTATQLQMVQGKVQEAKPAFAIVEPATVPLTPSKPQKKIIIIGFLLLAFIGTASWILLGEDIWKKMKNNSIN